MGNGGMPVEREIEKEDVGIGKNPKAKRGKKKETGVRIEEIEEEREQKER